MLLKMAKEAGAAPWLFLRNFPRMHQYVVRGGGFFVDRLGPKGSRALIKPELTFERQDVVFRGVGLNAEVVIDFDEWLGNAPSS